MYKYFIKRLFDIIIAFCGLVVAGIPMLVVAIWIKTDSEGPVLYRQKRLGKNRLTVMKYRAV